MLNIKDMGKDKEYSIYNLLNEDAEFNITGPMSPVYFMQSVQQQLDIPFNRLARVSFDHVEVNNKKDGPDCITGHDTVMMAVEHPEKKDMFMMAMAIDTGTTGVMIALYQPKFEKITINPIYLEDKTYLDKLNEVEMIALFKDAFENKLLTPTKI